MTMNAQSLQKITPRHREIMLRLVRGHTPKKVREDLGLSQSRFSIIVNSPLFQLELKKMMARRETLQNLENEFLETVELGVKFHKTVLEAQPGNYTTDQKLKSATTMAVLGSKFIKPESVPENGDGHREELSYEERLRRVTVEESIKTFTPIHQEAPDEEILTMLESLHPPDQSLPVDDDIVELLGEEPEDEIGDPPTRIDDILAQASGEKN